MSRFSVALFCFGYTSQTIVSSNIPPQTSLVSVLTYHQSQATCSFPQLPNTLILHATSDVSFHCRSPKCKIQLNWPALGYQNNETKWHYSSILELIFKWNWKLLIEQRPKNLAGWSELRIMLPDDYAYSINSLSWTELISLHKTN